MKVDRPAAPGEAAGQFRTEPRTRIAACFRQQHINPAAPSLLEDVQYFGTVFDVVELLDQREQDAGLPGIVAPELVDVAPCMRPTARMTDVIAVPVGGNAKRVDHPAKFTVGLPETLIKAFCPLDGTALDPFAGSGMGLLAAKKLGREFYGFEVFKKYVKLAQRRIDQADGVDKAG